MSNICRFQPLRREGLLLFCDMYDSTPRVFGFRTFGWKKGSNLKTSLWARGHIVLTMVAYILYTEALI